MKSNITEKQKADHWVKQIDRWMNGRRDLFGKDALKDIRATIKSTERVTKKQIQAIKNIKYGKDQGSDEI